MNGISRGIRNAFRNTTRTVALVAILGLSLGLALAMLVAHQAVVNKIASVKKSVGNTISISPAGARGFEGGGTALTSAQMAKVAKLAHVSSVVSSLSDRLTTDNTSLQSAVDAGSLGQRFAQRSGDSFSFQSPPAGGVSGSTNDATTPSVTRTFTPPVTVNGTTDPTNLSSSATSGGGTFTLKSGKSFDGTSSDNVALVGATLATKNNLKVGSTFTAYGTTITVVGIFDAGNTFSNNQVVMPLATVQKLSSQIGSVTSATATVDSVDNLTSTTKAITSALGSTADVTNEADTANATVQPLENIKTVSLYSLIGAVVAGAVIIFMTMLMIVRERRREIGVIKAIGASNLKVITQFMAEAVTLTVLAAGVGIILGAAAANPITNMLVSNSTSSSSQTVSAGAPGAVQVSTTTGGPVVRGGFANRAFGGATRSVTKITASVGWSIIAYGLGAAVLIALVGSGVASLFIAKIRPAEVMRTE